MVENVRVTRKLLGADILLAPHQTGGTAIPAVRTGQTRSRWNSGSNAERKAEITAAFKGPDGREWRR